MATEIMHRGYKVITEMVSASQRSWIVKATSGSRIWLVWRFLPFGLTRSTIHTAVELVNEVDGTD